MTERSTPYGRLVIGGKLELFARAAQIAVAAHARRAPETKAFTWALTGGSTPKEWYRWCVESHALPRSLTSTTHFTVSDERHVPLSSDESNFGTATRLLLDPLGVPADHRHPWLTENAPDVAADLHARMMRALAGEGRAYDLCFLGMGDDAHTASLFPGSPLLTNDRGLLFAAVEVPGKGPRLTATPTGLRACGEIVVMTLGAAKAPALARVLAGDYAPLETPSQLLKTCAGRVTWLVDAAAAGV